MSYLLDDMTNIFNTIILLGAIQGFILSVLLFISGKKQYANRLLGILIFLMALASLKVYLNAQEWFESNRIFQIISAFVPFFIIMPIGPLIYFYLRTFVEPGYRITTKQRAHFYPLILDLIPQLAAVFYILGLIVGFLKPSNQGFLANFIDTWNVYMDLPRWISVAVYISLSARLISLWSQQKMIQPAGHLKEAQVRSLKQFLRVFIFFQIIWLIYLIPYLIPAYSDKMLNVVGWYPIYLPMAILIYWLGFKGYLLSLKALNRRSTGISVSTALAAPIIEQTILSLKKAMEEDRLYLDPNLNLQLLSKKTGIASKTISTVLNQYQDKSFNEFINAYRVAEIKKRLLNPENKGITIAGLAYECGFNSQPTFQRAFKAIHGQTPKEFLLTNS
jgi:AraC-like DNA-binding protein